MRPPTIFVTGMQRSGTTLLEKLLSSHPEISVLSQPFPFLFLEVKREFYRFLGQDPPLYPLGPLFGERYRPDDLIRFLREHRILRAQVESAFAAMEGFSGQYTRFDGERLEAALAALTEGPFDHTLEQLYRSLSPSPRATLCGGKETLCEEYLPFLLAQGFRALLILRDPRDVLASLNHGRGGRYGGKLKPTLFNIRNWRKSVAVALHLQDHPHLMSVRYEDLVAEPGRILERIARFLAVDPFPPEVAAGRLRDQKGRPWSGNSSFAENDGISAASVGRYRQALPAEVVSFIEAACEPELAHLGYPRDRSRLELEQALRTFEEPYPLERPELAEYLPSPRSVADELDRLEILERGSGERSRQYFLFEDVVGRLRASGGRL